MSSRQRSAWSALLTLTVSCAPAGVSTGSNSPIRVSSSNGSTKAAAEPAPPQTDKEEALQRKLRSLPNVILGAHNGSNTREGVTRASKTAVDFLIEELSK